MLASASSILDDFEVAFLTVKYTINGLLQHRLQHFLWKTHHTLLGAVIDGGVLDIAAGVVYHRRSCKLWSALDWAFLFYFFFGGLSLEFDFTQSLIGFTTVPNLVILVLQFQNMGLQFTLLPSKSFYLNVAVGKISRKISRNLLQVLNLFAKFAHRGSRLSWQ